jgi:hypothetical protein
MAYNGWRVSEVPFGGILVNRRAQTKPFGLYVLPFVLCYAPLQDII